MKAQELRIGNWVYQQSSKMVKEDVYSTPYKIQNVNSQTGFKYQPIPLTEEILLKCGFVKKEGYYYYLNTKFILDDKFTLLDIDIFVRIQYLHQLQNLIYSLTNQELEIKL